MSLELEEAESYELSVEDWFQNILFSKQKFHLFQVLVL